MVLALKLNKTNKRIAKVFYIQKTCKIIKKVSSIQKQILAWLLLTHAVDTAATYNKKTSIYSYYPAFRQS